MWIASLQQSIRLLLLIQLAKPSRGRSRFVIAALFVITHCKAQPVESDASDVS